MRRMTSKRIGLCLVLLMILLQIATPALSDSPTSASSPVDASGSRIFETCKEWFYGMVTKDGKEVEMTDAELEAYINERFRDGKPTTETWLDTYNLFRACSIRAGDKREPRQDSRRWREMSLAAAGTCLEQDRLDVQIAPWAAKYCKDEGWFCDRLLAMYQERLDGPPEQRAAALYNIGVVLEGTGNYALASEAYASAHNLFPDDPEILYWLQRCQKEQGDYEASLKTLNESEKPVDVTSCASLMSEVRRKVEAGELLMKMGKDEKALQILEATWRMLGEAVALGAEHENMAVQHTSGKAKFLEDPLNGSKTRGPAAVAAEIKKALG